MAHETDNSSAGWIKLDLLSNGVVVDDSVYKYLAHEAGFAHRKNVYNSPNWGVDTSQLPQEIRIFGFVVGLNSYGPSTWKLEFSNEFGRMMLVHLTGERCPVDLIRDLRVFASNKVVAQVANLYGGSALAFFSPRTCYFFSDGTECGFCSLAGTAGEDATFRNLLTDSDVRLAVRMALESDPDRIEQIMVVGGNLRDLDRGFKHHVELAAAAEVELRKAGLTQAISVHIATMPPRDLELLHLLAEFDNIHVMFNLEIWDTALFETVCVGKQKDYGRGPFLDALGRLRDIIGPYRAHSLLVTGIENPSSTVAGAHALANMGISPIINIYHSDRFSRLGLSVRPSFSQLTTVARGLQEVYARFPVQPYWRNCGRNAIDAEAKCGLFRTEIPAFLMTAIAN